MTPRLATAIRDFMADHRLDGTGSPYVFHHAHDRRQAKRGERVRSFRRAFDSAAERAKLPDAFVRHDLRHRRVTTWLEAGHPYATVQAAMGHSSITVTEGYAHLVRDSLKRLVEAPDDGRAKLKELA